MSKREKENKQPNWIWQALVVAVIASVVGDVVNTAVTIAAFIWSGLSRLNLSSLLANFWVLLVVFLVSLIVLIAVVFFGIVFARKYIDDKAIDTIASSTSGWEKEGQGFWS